MEQVNPICWIGASFDACALWRLYQPHFGFPGSIFCLFAQRPDFNKITQNEVCVVQRCCTKEQFDFLKLVRQLGMKVIYDLDDNFWEIPTFNPAYPVLQHYRNGFLSCMTMVDAITVSTKHLESVVKTQMRGYFKQRQIPVLVTQNKIRPAMFAPPVQKEEMIVGWAGSTSHSGDLMVAQEALQKLAEENTGVTFEFRGMMPPESLRPLPNVRFKVWNLVSEFPIRMPLWGWSIALAPLTEDPFNKSKSAIKMIEAGYCGVPCLAACVEPYVYFASFDSELSWLLCGPDSWYKKLRELIHDEARRKFLGERMRAVVMKHFNLEVHDGGWGKALQAVGVDPASTYAPVSAESALIALGW